MMLIALLLVIGAAALLAPKVARAWRRRPPRVTTSPNSSPRNQVRMRFYGYLHRMLPLRDRADRDATAQALAVGRAEAVADSVKGVKPHVKPFIFALGILWALMLGLMWALDTEIFIGIHPTKPALAYVLGTVLAAMTVAGSFLLMSLLFNETLFPALGKRGRAVLLGVGAVLLTGSAGMTVALAPIRSETELTPQITDARTVEAVVKVEQPELLPVRTAERVALEQQLDTARATDRLVAVGIIGAEIILLNFALMSVALLVAARANRSVARKTRAASASALDRDMTENRLQAELATILERAGDDPQFVHGHLAPASAPSPAAAPAVPDTAGVPRAARRAATATATGPHSEPKGGFPEPPPLDITEPAPVDPPGSWDEA